MRLRTTAILGLSALAAVAACAACASRAATEDEVGSGEGEIIERPSLVARHVDEGAITIDGKIDEAWSRAPSTTFDTAWSGDHTTTKTTVRALWTESALFMLWELDSAGLNVDTSRPVEVERQNLFQEDCVEVFVSPNPDERRRYFEIELGPRGHFFDLLIDRRTTPVKSDEAFSSKAEIKTKVDEAAHKAVIEVALRNAELAQALQKGVDTKLPMNMFRMEGKSPRQFLAWSPTRTPRPNFHVPEAFGTLSLEK